MKRIAFVSLLAVLSCVSAMAQYRPRPNYPRPIYERRGYDRPSSFGHSPYTYYGFRLGMNVATVNSDSKLLDSNSPKTGLNVGFALGTHLAMTPLCFETGLYYTEKGGKSKYEGNKFTYSLNYLEVPLVIKYRAFTTSGITIEPFLGGYLACGVGGKIKDYGVREAYSSFGNDYSEAFKRFDGGLRLGCGFSYDMLYLEAGYDIGLANVGKDSFDDTHTGALNLTVGVNF